MKIRSPQSTGVELPPSGSDTLQRTFFVALHSTGRFFSFVTPAPSTPPRHDGQWAAPAAAANQTRDGKIRAVFMAALLAQDVKIGSNFFHSGRPFRLAGLPRLWKVWLSYEKNLRALHLDFDSVFSSLRIAGPIGPATNAPNRSAAEQPAPGGRSARIQTWARAAPRGSRDQQRRGAGATRAGGCRKSQTRELAQNDRVSKETRGGGIALGPVRVGAALPPG